jgi:hypothetical protein
MTLAVLKSVALKSQSLWTFWNYGTPYFSIILLKLDLPLGDQPFALFFLADGNDILLCKVWHKRYSVQLEIALK